MQAKAGWEYGDAGDRIPVEVGDIWRVGPHVVGCGDIERGANEQLLGIAANLMQAEPAMAYVDPPYNASLAKGYRSKAGYVDEAADYEALLSRIMGPIGSVDLYVEGSIRDKEKAPDWFRCSGYAVVNSWEITYHRTMPAMLYQLHRDIVDAAIGGNPADPSGFDDEMTPAWAISRSSRPGDVVYDCCMGMGLTAVSAERLGRRALGLELNHRRLAVTIDRLSSEFGYEYEKIGELG